MKALAMRRPGLARGLQVLAVVAAVLLPAAAGAAYPERPIRMIVPFAPGGGADTVARIVANGLSERLGQQIVVDNRSGAGGVIGTELGSRAAPDGYTLTFVPASFTMQPALRKLPYDPLKSFAPVSRVGKGDYALAVNPTVPAKTAQAFIAYVKENPNKLFFGTAGAGSTAHLFTELFKLKAGLDFSVVHFKGGNQQVVALLGGEIQAIAISLPAVRPHILSGKLRGLATMSRERSSFFDNLPTLHESGLPGFEAIVWWGVLAPAGTPDAVVRRLDAAIQEVLAAPATRKAFANQGVEPDYQGAAAFRPFIAREIGEWNDVVKRAGIELK